MPGNFFSRHRPLLLKIGAFFLALLLWEAVALLFGERVLLASPVDVLRRLYEYAADFRLHGPVLYSTVRIMVGVLIGLLVGCAAALLAGRFPVAEILLYPYMVTIRSVPVASFVVLAMIWLSAGQFSGFIAFLIVLPIVYNALLGALRGMDRALSEMADVFHFRFCDRLFYIWLPQLRPALLSASATAVGLGWKSGVAAELIGVARGGVGWEIYLCKQSVDTAGLFGWTLIIVLCSLVCEKLFLLGLRAALGGGKEKRHARSARHGAV